MFDAIYIHFCQFDLIKNKKKVAQNWIFAASGCKILNRTGEIIS